MEYINGIKIYKSTNFVVDLYNRHSNPQTRMFIERKLSAIVNATAHKTNLDDGNTLYRFGSFSIVTYEPDNRIVNINWSNKSTYISGEMNKKLTDGYNKVGISKRGNSFTYLQLI
jgi:hypothetical protein